MSIDQQLRNLADDYGLPANKLKLCCFLIDCMYAQPNLPKTQNIESKAKTACKKNPNDSEAQAILLEAQRMRSTFSYNAMTKALTIYENDELKKNSVRIKFRQNYAIWELVCLWEEHNGRIPSSDGEGSIRPLGFVSTTLHYLGDENIPHNDALRKRIDDLRKDPDGKTKPRRRNLYYSSYKPDTNNAAIRDEDGNIILPRRS